MKTALGAWLVLALGIAGISLLGSTAAEGKKMTRPTVEQRFGSLIFSLPAAVMRWLLYRQIYRVYPPLGCAR